jgi:hypothetical protein
MGGIVRTVIRILAREGNSRLFSKTSRSILKKIKNHPIQWVPGAVCPGISGRRVKLPTNLHLVQKLRMSGNVPPLLYAFMACMGKILPSFSHILVGLSVKENDIVWAHIMEDLINVYRNLVGNT